MMSSVKLCELPDAALLCKYKRDGAYTDCYFIDVAGVVSHAGYVEAFYTSALFRVERRILAMCVSRPSTDLQARQLACGESQVFAAWSVEGRAANQLLLCDFLGHTRSWLMSEVRQHGPAGTTRLYFGSAVIPQVDGASGRARFGFAFHSLKGFHKLYSHALLRSALAGLAQAS